MQFNQLPIKTSANSGDYLAIQDFSTKITHSITKADLLAGLSNSNQSNTSASSVVTSGLIADYCFDELQGVVLKDKSSNAYNGTIFTSTAWLSYANAGLDFKTNGYVKLPNSVWFSGDLTIEVVVNPRSYQNWSRLVDFGNGQAVDNLYFALSNGTSGKPAFGVLNGDGSVSPVTSSVIAPIYQWSHWMVSLSGTTASIFNGLTPVASGTTLIPTNTTKTINYVGKSAFSGDGQLDGSIAMVRMWNRALTTNERIQEFLATRSILNSQGIIF